MSFRGTFSLLNRFRSLTLSTTARTATSSVRHAFKNNNYNNNNTFRSFVTTPSFSTSSSSSLWNGTGTGSRNVLVTNYCGGMWMQTRTFASKRHKAVLRQTKGFRGRAKNCFTIAIRKLQKAWQYAYIDRKKQKRNWRKLWIIRVSAGCRQYNLRYSQFIPMLHQSNITLNRKVLSEMASMEPFSFKAIVDVTKHCAATSNTTHEEQKKKEAAGNIKHEPEQMTAA